MKKGKSLTLWGETHDVALTSEEANGFKFHGEILKVRPMKTGNGAVKCCVSTIDVWLAHELAAVSKLLHMPVDGCLRVGCWLDVVFSSGKSSPVSGVSQETLDFCGRVAACFRKNAYFFGERVDDKN